MNKRFAQLLRNANEPAEIFISVRISRAGLCTLIITETVSTGLWGTVLEAVWLYKRLFRFK